MFFEGSKITQLILIQNFLFKFFFTIDTTQSYKIIDRLIKKENNLYCRLSRKMQDGIRISKSSTPCDRHFRPVISICTAPQCSSFRQLCSQCVKNDHHHAKMHFDKNQAFAKVQDDIDNLFKGLKALRKKIIQTMDTKVNSQHGLNQIEQKLQQIKKILTNKIDNFHLELRKLYEKNVKDKLNQLFYIVEKSHQFLQEEKIKLFKSQKLRPFFENDLNHDLKYYQSYYEQILQKNVRRFKAGFQHDKVLKLMVTFQQNLSQIFKFQSTTPAVQQNSHLLFGNQKGNFLLKMKGNQFRQGKLTWISKQDTWVGMLPSIYYSSNDSYYLIGDGRKQSNKIRRMNVENMEIRDLQVKLETKRMNFSVCLFNQEIFIIGGENSKEGCLSKCQKFIPSEGKVYIVSSLNQKSAQHNVIVYKNKFILKFGGTNIMGSILQTNSERYVPLMPEIYSAETEDWKILNFQGLSSHHLGGRINFGLWPGIFSPFGDNQIIVLSGQQVMTKGFKSRFDITVDENNLELNQLKIEASKVSILSKNLILSECSSVDENGNICFLLLDRGRSSGHFINAFITRSSDARQMTFSQDDLYLEQI